MVLLASFGVAFAFLIVARLFPGQRTRLPAAKVTDHQFVLVLEETNAAFDPWDVRDLFDRFNAVETIEREAASAADGPGTSVGGQWLTNKRLNVGLLAVLVAVLVLNLLMATDPTRPNSEFFPNMAHAVTYRSFAVNPNFPDGRTLQTPVKGTIARGHMPFHFSAGPEEALRAGKELKNPLASDDKQAKLRGPVLFSHHCQVCHGPEGKGDGPVTQRGVPPPPSLLAEKAVLMPDGQIFHVLTFGQGNMASYATHLSADERWYVIGHIRAMQKQAGGK
jgi:mono/diheme cytochrome c family protein